LLEVFLDGNPGSATPRNIKQDQDDRELLLEPEVVIPDVHIIHIIWPRISTPMLTVWAVQRDALSGDGELGTVMSSANSRW
jgi:hypothetical protein